ncbi:hypothetical protein TCDM_12757 [Trypanosoma cruzi Dm28c]|uniref:Uncharacterized protein n=1 Tax=Trypanosoma cruzi Dm28c TaxID=1416333 RepID=V5CK55_TRYCR|nr:hypothetical protein TCDM_12757 [Trypanosoma cruzi Dm28c]
MPVGPSCSTRPLLAVPRNHGNETAACGGYRAHLRVVTANNGPLSVARSNPRNRRSVCAWDQRTLTFSVTHRCTRMPRHFNAACMAAPRCMYPPGPSHPSCWWKACPDNTKRAHPQASQTNILPSQITASASLTSSAGSVMGQLSIGRLADLSWILRLRANHWHTNPRCNFWQEHPMLRACGIFTHVQCGALPLRQRTARITTPTRRLRHPPVHPHAAQISKCDQRKLRAVDGATNRCHPLIPRVALRPVRLQRPPFPHRHSAVPRQQCRRILGVPLQPSWHSSSLPPPTAPCHAHR